jgi:hypothetical protein
MRHLALAIAAVALSTVAASVPAKADPFHLIRWSDTGFCQIWDEGIPTMPSSGNYTVVSMTVPTFFDALNIKNGMLWTRECAL